GSSLHSSPELPARPLSRLSFPSCSSLYPPALPDPPDLPGSVFTNVARNPNAPKTNPASDKYGDKGCPDGGTPSISSMSIPRGASPPVRARSMRTCATARATFDRSGSASGSHVTSCRSPRARYAASAPLTRITVAPTDRVGARPAFAAAAASTAASARRARAEPSLRAWLAEAPAGAEAGHLSVAPYGVAGSG